MPRSAVFTVTLNKPSDKNVYVDYRTQDGTATIPDDYKAQSGTLTFLPGEIEKKITVEIRDSIPTAMIERFSVIISAPRNANIKVDTAIATIPPGSEVAVNGPLINKGLITNAFHNAQGRGGYFHHNSGTSEGQSIGIEGSFLAYEVLNGGTVEEQNAASWYLDNGKRMLDAMGDGGVTGPMLRQTVSSDPNTLTLLHWLFAARGEVPLQQIEYNKVMPALDGKVTVFTNDRPAVNAPYRAFRIFPVTSKLVYQSPYSPAFDQQDVVEGDKTVTKVWSDSSIALIDSDYTIASDGSITVTIPTDRSRFSPNAPASYPGDVRQWYVVYGYSNAGTLPQGKAQEAYPMWTALPDGYAACAPDTFRWFENAMTIAIEQDPRPDRVILWNHLRAGLRRTAVKGQSINDGRLILEPMPSFPVFPASGDPTGMFEYNERAFADRNKLELSTPEQPYIGYSGMPDNKISSTNPALPTTPPRWSRYGGESGETLHNDITWNADNMLDQNMRTNFTMDKGGLLNGTIQTMLPYIPFYYPHHTPYSSDTGLYPRWPYGTAAYPALEGDRTWRYSIGRGVGENYRKAENYQDADQYLFLAYKGKGNDVITAYVSSSQVYSADTRYTCDKYIEVMSLDRTDPTGKAQDISREYIRYFLFDLSDFKRASDGSQMPVGLGILNAALIITPKHELGKYTNYVIDERWSRGSPTYKSWLPRFDFFNRNIIALRLVSGATKEWVRNNLQAAVKGSVMPWFPGAMPFAINGDTIKQRIVGWSGSPFHGYQLPDYWYFLEADAFAIHGNINPATDLPCSNVSGSIVYPISPNTASGVAKPGHAMLAEQQLLFLKSAADKWVADGGVAGGFAHTFVMNTSARLSLGSPPPLPHTWIYTNDDPNTRWAGYAARVVESLARLVLLAKDNRAWDDAVGLSVTMAYNWINMLNGLWPNLNGKPYNDPEMGPVTLYGAPTDYPDPRISAPQTLYEEPHATALVLRAVVWLNLSGKLSAPQKAVVDAVGLRCWQYMEKRYRKDELDSMRYTWANFEKSTAESYFGFWEFEIITTIAQMLKNPSGVPAGIDLNIARQRLRETQSWVAAHTEY